MIKNIIIIVLMFIIILGAAFCWYNLMEKSETNLSVETPIPIVTETPIPETPEPQPFFFQQPAPAPTPIPTVDPYWIPGDWGPYHMPENYDIYAYG